MAKRELVVEMLRDNGEMQTRGCKTLRLLPTFEGGLREKIRTCAGFKKIPTNYISEESLINGVYDKSMI